MPLLQRDLQEPGRSAETTHSAAGPDGVLPATVRLGVLIRFKNSVATLPAVLAALKAQTIQPDLIVGIDSGSSDGSAELLAAAGARVIPWTAPYHHAKVLNFGLARCPAEYVLALSSHTVLQEPDVIERMLGVMQSPDAACVSGKWSEEDSWSNSITWSELRATGLRFCSIYSNSFGMLRRALWEATRFDERLVTMEDYAWALEQVRRGHVCHRLAFPFSYQRGARRRDYAFAAITFSLAHRYGLRVGWLGAKATLRALLAGLFDASLCSEALLAHRDRFLASLIGRFILPRAE
jgi:rhamnosyltransferase